MDNSSWLSLERKFNFLATLLTIFICLNGLGNIEAATDKTDNGIISFPAKCNCSLSMACTCCQGVAVNVMNFTRTLCITFKINLLKATADVTLSLDGNTMSKFTLNPKAPTSFCQPVLSEATSLVMCLKMSAKMSGLTNLNICPSFYSTFNANQLLAYDFSCIKLGMDGFSIV